MTPITFPDGAAHAVSSVRATHLLTKSGGAWTAPGISADYDGQQWRVDTEGVPHYLRYDQPNGRYVGGGWPNAIPTAFILRRSAAGATIGGVILEIWDVAYQGHGEFHIEGTSE